MVLGDAGIVRMSAPAVQVVSFGARSMSLKGQVRASRVEGRGPPKSCARQLNQVPTSTGAAATA